jgi:hypothetical protein
MGKTLSQLLQEADNIIEKRASVEVTPVAIEEDEIFKLAEQVRNHVPVVEKAPEPFVPTEAEKLAYAMAMLETILSSKELKAMDTFEKAAAEKGLSPESVQRFFEKTAASTKVGTRVFDFMAGAGRGLEGYIQSIPRNLSGAEGAGRAVGAALPIVGAGVAGGMLGSSMKENEIKSKYGIV